MNSHHHLCDTPHSHETINLIQLNGMKSKANRLIFYIKLTAFYSHSQFFFDLKLNNYEFNTYAGMCVPSGL